MSDLPGAGADDRHRAHPLGDARRTERPQRAPARRRGRAGRGRSTTASSRTTRRSRPNWRPRASSSPATPTPRSSPTCSGASCARPERPWPTRCARSAGGSTARSPWSSLDRDQPDVIVAARRNSPLVVGVGRAARCSSAATSPRSSSSPATRSSSARTRSSRSRATAYAITDFDGAPAAGRPFHVDWDLAAAEKGGYEYFMLKEIAEQPAAAADTLRGHLVDGRIVLDEQRLDERELREIDKVVRGRVRHRLSRRDDRQAGDRALDPGAGRGRDGLGVPLPRPGARPADAGRRDQPVGRDR